MTLRLVFDSNAIVSAAITTFGLQRTALNFALNGQDRLYYSPEIMSEYAEVLARPKFKLTRGRRLQMLQLIRNGGYLVTPKIHIEACIDPDDNIFLECADAARADYLVTGNIRHYPTFWKSTKIITARELLGLVAPHLLT